MTPPPPQLLVAFEKITQQDIVWNSDDHTSLPRMELKQKVWRLRMDFHPPPFTKDCKCNIQNFFITMLKKAYFYPWNVSSSKSHSIQVLHQQFFWGGGGRGVKAYADSADAGGRGGSKIMENLLT